ncbi:MAG: ubiquitin-like domain-containing protein [Anaerolineales bacterium]|nr:ubiquitin-like domain-containing protein [Anaerolineales bacterium]
MSAIVLISTGCSAPAPPLPLVRVDADGRTVELRTASNDLNTILGEAAVTLNPGDELWVDGAPIAPGSRLESVPARLSVRRALTVSIVEGGVRRTFTTAARTVGEALWQAGFRLNRADSVQPPLNAPLTANLEIFVRPARPITVQADGTIISARVQAQTVGEALAEAGVPLIGLDYAVPAADQPLPMDGMLRVVRVREETLIEQTLIRRETVYQALPDVEIDTVQTLQAGADGLQRRSVRVRYEDGVEVSRTAEAEVLAQAAQPRVIGYGTKITPRTLETPDGVVEYWRAYTVYATSYSPSRAGVPPTARNFGLTATGKRLTKGMVAVDRRYIPLGTRMYIPGYGFAVAEDTGSGVRGRFIDLGYDDSNYVSWSKVVTVYFLTPIPPPDQIVWIIPSTVP